MKKNNNFYFNLRNKIFFSIITFLSSCAPENELFSENFQKFEIINRFKVVSVFSLNDHIYAQQCDSYRNKLLLKFSKNSKSWKRTKYITKGCN